MQVLLVKTCENCVKKTIIANVAFNPANGCVWDRAEYFDPELCQRRTVIEGAFAQYDGFGALLIRHEASVTNWISLNLMAISLNLMAMAVGLLGKFQQNKC